MVKFTKVPKELKEIVKACYPNYNGRKYRLGVFDHPMQLNSYWDEGSRDYFAFYHLLSKQVIQVHSNHPFFEKGYPSLLKDLPENIALVEHSIFCGRDLGICVYVNFKNMPALLEE